MSRGVSPYFSSASASVDYKGPVLQYTRCWSQTLQSNSGFGDYYFVYPTAATWAANVATFTAPNHFLTTADTVIVSSNVSAWNVGATAATVTDANTFTIAIVGDPGAFPDRDAAPLYGGTTANFVLVQVKKYSRLMFQPAMIQIGTFQGGAGSLKIMAKTHPLANWIDVQDVLFSDAEKIYTFAIPFNFMRLERNAGADNNMPDCYYQSMSF